METADDADVHMHVHIDECVTSCMTVNFSVHSGASDPRSLVASGARIAVATMFPRPGTARPGSYINVETGQCSYTQSIEYYISACASEAIDSWESVH